MWEIGCVYHVYGEWVVRCGNEGVLTMACLDDRHNQAVRLDTALPEGRPVALKNTFAILLHQSLYNPVVNGFL